MTTPGICVTGDVAIDRFEIIEPPRAGVDDGRAHNWQLHGGVARHTLPAGAMLLADLAAHAAGITPAAPRFTRKKPAVLTGRHMVMCEASLTGGAPCLVREKKGYTGPPEGSLPQCLSPKSTMVDFPVDARGASVVIVDDAGNGFRDAPHLFPDRETISDSAVVLYKMHAPLMQGPCRQWLQEIESSQKNVETVVLVDANDVRAMPEVDISRALSWEKTALDFAEHISLNPYLKELSECANLVVLFDTDGAIFYRGTENETVSLVYDPKRLEGDFRQTLSGDMLGKEELFSAVLGAALYREGIAGLEEGITQGLSAMRQLLRNGYDPAGGRLRIPYGALFGRRGGIPFVRMDPEDITTYYTVPVRRPPGLGRGTADTWTILDEKTANTRELIAENIVRFGTDDTVSAVPEIRFGKALTTIDRSEIESYSGIAKLMQEYLFNPRPKRPLCFAVFGAPGAGKSFGVKQIAKGLSAKSNCSIPDATYNISQFAGYRALVNALHKTRDTVLAGNVPLVFFDEFDSPLGDRKLGWLKYFLAPMQDGEFLDGETTYHIGKAIFVFAGGTCSTFEEFAGERPDEEPGGIAGYEKGRAQDLKGAKVPDFISRLKGFVNIMGPSPQCAVAPDGKRLPDEAYILRRAKILRHMFERSATTGMLFDRGIRGSGKGMLHIDSGVLRGLLKVPAYKHGNRSMESIIEMSRLSGRRVFDKAALPPREQLKIHVDTEVFFALIEKDRFTSPADCADNFMQQEDRTVSRLAAAVHRDYVRMRKLNNQDLTVPESFDALSEPKKASNRHAAEDIPRKMRAITMGIRRVPAGCFPQTPVISEAERARLAEMEHERWLQEQKRQGFRYGSERDDDAKTNPNMVPYDELDPAVKAYDLEAVTAIPMVLAECGFELYRMEERQELNDPEMLDILARLHHADYVKNRQKQGDAPESNRSLRPFDELAEDLKYSNRDNAAHIPVKLKAIGYGIRPVKKGCEPVMPEFTAEEIESMARMEHDRWSWERRLQGWVLKGGEKDVENKTTPHLVPYDDLPDDVKEYDRESVRLIPGLLARAGYEAYRVE